MSREYGVVVAASADEKLEIEIFDVEQDQSHLELFGVQPGYLNITPDAA